MGKQRWATSWLRTGVEMNQRHPVGIAEEFVMTSGLNRLRFAGAEELLNIGVGVIDETGRAEPVNPNETV